MLKKTKKTALVLSGGGSRGAYQIGVWQALREMGIEIHMVTGTSAGAVNGAAVVQDTFETACDIWKELDTETVFHFSEAFKNGGGNYDGFKKLLSGKLDEKAIRSSQLEFGIVTVGFPSMEPRYLWKEDIPQGQLLDYILASASCFPAVQSYGIGEEKYIDGGYGDNMPVSMALSRGASHIIAVNLRAAGVMKKDALLQAEHAVLIEPCWELGNWLKFDGANTQRIMRLGYLDTMKAYGAYDGRFYTFLRGAWDKRSLKGAEQAGAVFGLDPGLIYSRSVFLEYLSHALEEYAAQEEKDLLEAEQMFSRFLQDKGLISAVLEKSDLARNVLNTFLINLAKLPPANSKTLTLLLARRIREMKKTAGRKTRFSKPVLGLFAKEIGAASFLADFDLA